MSRFIHGLYWMFLGLWLGAIVMFAVAAGAVFATLARYEPTIGIEPLSRLSDVAPSRIMAGGVVGRIIVGLAVIQLICAVMAALTAVLQCTLFRRSLPRGGRSPANVARLLMLGLAMLILAVDLLWINPGVGRQATIMYDPNLPAETRFEARTRFDTLHKTSERAVTIQALLLAAALLTSAFALNPRENQPQMDTDEHG
ncbi:MAG: hypothetical protein WD042_01010 [Phycisphaeraceae bacterium]